MTAPGRNWILTLVALGGCAAGIDADTAPSSSSQSTLVLHANGTSAARPRDNADDTVQIALLLDTSSSMDGLINQARSHLWNIVDQMGRMRRDVNGKTRGVKIELALYEYGNTTIPQSAGYIRQVQAFTTDLDKVSEQLHALFTNGGDEYAGQAIVESVGSLQWSSDPDALRFVFVAGNESFDQGPIKAAEAMAVAAKRDITVQLILCGGTDASWEAAARIAKTDLMTIDQDHVAHYIAAPQDDELLRLGQELNATYMAYGADGDASVARQHKADKSAAKMNKKVALERAQMKSKKGYDNSRWDLVDAVDKDAKFLDKAKDNQLPASMRGKSLDEKKKIVAANAAKRAELKAKIAALEAERTKHIAAEQAKQGADSAQSLDTELMKATKKSASKKGYKF